MGKRLLQGEMWYIEALGFVPLMTVLLVNQQTPADNTECIYALLAI